MNAYQEKWIGMFQVVYIQPTLILIKPDASFTA